MVLAIAALSSRVRSNIGIIRAGQARGLSSNQIQSLIRQTGQPGIRRTDLLAGIRHVAGRAESGSRIMSTPRNRLPDPSRMELAKGPLISRFSFDVRIRGRSKLSGKREDRFVTVRSNSNLTPQEIMDSAQEMIDTVPEEARYGDLEDGAILTVIGARRRE